MKPGEGEAIHFTSHVWLGDKHPDSHIVDVGWSIFPLGYFFGYLKGEVDNLVWKWAACSVGCIATVMGNFTYFMVYCFVLTMFRIII